MNLPSLDRCQKDYVQFVRDIFFLATHKKEKFCGLLIKHISLNSFYIFPNRKYIEDMDTHMDSWILVNDLAKHHSFKEIVSHQK